MSNKRGYVFKNKSTGKWYARLTFVDNAGRRREIKKTAETKGEASKLLSDISAKFESSDNFAETIETERLTFNDLAKSYGDFKVKPAEYRGDRKTSGLRSYDKVALRVKALLAHFGKMKLRSITIGEIERFRQKRLNTKTKNGKERSIASVNRELEILRAMLRYAHNEGWIDFSPFERTSTPIISKADEIKRDRVLSKDEESRLLSVCVGAREHLKPLVIAALDTGMRRGELIALTWNDVNFDNRTITVRAMTTKTLTARTVPVSARLLSALESLYNRFSDRDLVFGIGTKFQHSWETACKLAGISDLRFHDLRATFCTRLIEAGMPIEQVAKLSGHTQLSTLYSHYLSTTAQAVERASQLLDQINQR